MFSVSGLVVSRTGSRPHWKDRSSTQGRAESVGVGGCRGGSDEDTLWDLVEHYSREGKEQRAMSASRRSPQKTRNIDLG